MFRARISTKRPEKSALRTKATKFTNRIKVKIVIKPLPAPLRSSLLKAIWEETPIARAK
jgi:hypothetical protein